MSGGDGGGGAVWVEEREESEKIEIKMNSEKKKIINRCLWIYIILL